MIRGLIHGRLFKAAEAKTSGAGKAFATATVALDGVNGDDGPRFARIVAFGELCDRLVTLPKGTVLAVTGKIEIGFWTPDSGKTEATIKVLADEIAAVRVTGGSSIRRGTGEGRP